MRSRLRILEGGVSRLEDVDELEAWTALQNLRGWASQWAGTLDVEGRLDLADASLQLYRLQGIECAEAEADRVIVEGRIRRYLQAEGRYVQAKVEEHLAATPARDRSRWRALYREAQHADATGSESAG